MSKGVGLLLVVLLFIPGLSPSAHAQGGGCPPEPARAWIGDWGEQILLSPGIPEGAPLDTARGVFGKRQVVVAVDPATQRVIISSTQFEKLCLDDAFDLSVLSTNVTWRLDFRAGGVIQPANPVDITDMFTAGEQTVTITLIDLERPQASGSPIWLSIIPRDQPLPQYVQIEHWKGPQPTVIPSPTPPGTPIIEPTSSPSPTSEAPVTRPPRPTPTRMARLAAAPAAEDTGQAALPLPWPVLALALIAPGGLVVWLWRRSRSQDYPQGEVEIEIDGQPLPGISMPIALANFKKPVVRAGGGLGCDIHVPGEGVPPILVQFRAERDEFGELETLLDRFDPVRQEVVETFVLGSGDTLSIHPLTVIYTNYAQQEPIIIEGGYFHA